MGARGSGPRGAATGDGRWSRFHAGPLAGSRNQRGGLDRCTGKRRWARQFFFCNFDAFLENVEGYCGFVFVDDEGRGEAEGVCAAAEDEESAFEGEVDDAIAEERG